MSGPATEESGLFDVLVVDSGAIIRGHGTNFHRIAKRLVTVSEVLNEIRDSKAREFLESLPFELEVLSPSEASLRAVGEFAKRSGDFAALSLTDLRIIALSYTMEVEINGGAHIRTEPSVCSLIYFHYPITLHLHRPFFPFLL